MGGGGQQIWDIASPVSTPPPPPHWWGLLWQTKKRGLRHGSGQKGDLRHGLGLKRGFLCTGQDKKGRYLPRHIHVLQLDRNMWVPPPPPARVMVLHDLSLVLTPCEYNDRKVSHDFIMMAAKDFSLFLCFCFSFFSYAVLIYADSTEDKNAYQYMTNSFKYINGGDTLSQSKNQIKLGPFEADLKFHARLHELLQHPSHDVSGISPSMILSQRNQVAKSNLLLHDNRKITSENPWSSPGSIAKGFVIPTLTGTLHYPGAIINESSPILFHSFNPHSGFLDCMWNCSGTMPEFVNNSPNLTHYVFMSNSPDASKHIQWMHDRLSAEIRKQQRYGRY